MTGEDGDEPGPLMEFIVESIADGVSWLGCGYPCHWPLVTPGLLNINSSDSCNSLAG